MEAGHDPTDFRAAVLCWERNEEGTARPPAGERVAHHYGRCGRSAGSRSARYPEARSQRTERVVSGLRHLSSGPQEGFSIRGTCPAAYESRQIQEGIRMMEHRDILTSRVVKIV